MYFFHIQTIWNDALTLQNYTNKTNQQTKRKKRKRKEYPKSFSHMPVNS